MNERGTYGNGHGTNGHSTRDRCSYGPPMLGGDADLSSWRKFGALLLSLGAGAFAGHAVAENSNKGVAFGIVGGFFAHLMMQQHSELKRINQQLAQQR